MKNKRPDIPNRENMYFYDIESLDNVFSLVNYRSRENILDVYILCDNPQEIIGNYFEAKAREAIYEANRNTTAEIQFHNLAQAEANHHLAKTFGLSSSQDVNNILIPSDYPLIYRPACTTDDDYNQDEHPYIAGYNSYQYDTTMLAYYLSETFYINPNERRSVPKPFYLDNYTLDTKPVADVTDRKLPKNAMAFKQNRSLFVENPNYNFPGISITPPTANAMRRYNDTLFSKRFKKYMPSALQYQDPTNDYRDFNTNQNKIRRAWVRSGRYVDVAKLNEKQAFVALKRLLGLLGHQILESDKLTNNTTIQSEEELIDLIAYNVSDVVNLELLFYHDVYKGAFDLKRSLLKTYPDVVYDKKVNSYEPNIRPDKVRWNRATIDTTSAQLSSMILAPYGPIDDIETVSFMYPHPDEAKKLGIEPFNVLEWVHDYIRSHHADPVVQNQFENIYRYYKSIEGKNFNESDHYKNLYPNQKTYVLNQIPKHPNNIPYYNKDNTPSSCYATLSTGGVHGAQYNLPLKQALDKATNEKQERYDTIRYLFPDPIELKKAKKIEIGDKIFESKEFLTSKSTQKNAEYKKRPEKKPLFKVSSNGNSKIEKQFIFTSNANVIHEDFKSYYPLLLIRLKAFHNEGLGYDRYYEIYLQKEKYGKLQKDPSLSEEERKYYHVLREGTKLILNSITGVADSNWKTNTQMNNTIISMRIIGQLFTYTIGVAQTIAGGEIISTNTDGLYSTLDEATNNQILEELTKKIKVDIEPEPMYLISKDSNNRIELSPDLEIIFNASGDLSCWEGPNPSQALSNPAIIDWALTHYLVECAKAKGGFYDDFDEDLGRSILESAKEEFDTVKYLNMYQNLLASSNGSNRYIYGIHDDIVEILPHYNRTFIMKDNTENTLNLRIATAKKLTPATINKRKRENEVPFQHDPVARDILLHYDLSIEDYEEENKEAASVKINGVDESWPIYIQNRALDQLSEEETDFIISNLDIDRYLYLLKMAYENNWKNEMPAK